MPGYIGSALAQVGTGAVGNWLGNVFGVNNASQEQDCYGALGVLGSVDRVLQMYPQCQPYAAALRGGQQTAGGGMQYPLPVPMVTQNSFTPPAQMQALPITYLPITNGGGMMGMRPTAGMMGMMLRALPNMGGWTTGGVIGMAGRSARSALPVLDRSIALASGYQLVRGLWYDRSGQVAGRSRRRRRINPLNYRAALRAASRLQKVHDLTAKIERALPKQRKSKSTWPKKRKRS